MLKNYFVLCGIEQSFNFHVFDLKRSKLISNKCRFSEIKINMTTSLIQIHTKRKKFFINLNKRTLSLISNWYTYASLRKYIDLLMYCLVEK